MATTTIPWGDGSGDNIYLTYPSASGDQTVQVTSDANTGAARSKTVTFATGNISKTLTVNQDAGGPQECTIRLIPSSYSRSNTNYVTVTNPSNMYNNTDHTANYCTLRGRAGRSSNSTYYAFINGFNFSAVPSDATVKSFKVYIRAYRGQYMASGNTNYRICLASQASNSYKIGNTTLSEDITTTSGGTVYQIPTGNLTWNTLKGYGSGFSIDIPLRNSSTSNKNYPYVYVYGAEIEVTYEL